MNSAILTTFAGQMLAASSAVLITGFALHWLLRHRSAAQRELIWRTTFVILALLPATWLLRPWGLVQQEPELLTSQPVIAAVDSSPGAATDAAFVPVPVSVSFPAPVSPAAILFSVWAAGAALLLARLLLSTRLRSKWLAGARRCDSAMVSAIWNRMTRPAGARLLVSPACPVPLTWGRIVMLPQDALTWSEEQLQAALHHEMAHMIRRDWSFRRAGEFAAALFWPHPLVWLARNQWHRLQEQACDDAVIRAGSETAAYAELLCRAARVWTTPSAGAMAMAQPSSLEKRLLAVMNPACDRSPCSGLSVSVAVLIGLAAFTTAALAQKPAPAVPAKPPAAPVAPAAAEAKAATLILPRVQFAEASLKDAIAYLSFKAKELDPDKKGITLKGPTPAPAQAISLELRDASLWHVLGVIAELTGTHLEAGADTITFKAGPAAPKKAAAADHAIEAKAKGIILNRMMFEGATVDEMVAYVRRKCEEADTSPGKTGLNIVTKDAGKGTYSLSLRNVSAWEALDRIAKIAGMHGVGINVTTDGTESLVLDRSVIDPGISAEVAKSPQYQALERLKIAGEKSKTTLAEAAAALSRDIAAAPGGMRMTIKIAPAIANEPYDAEGPPGPATVRLTILTGLGKYELALDGDGFLIRPRAKE